MCFDPLHPQYFCYLSPLAFLPPLSVFHQLYLYMGFCFLEGYFPFPYCCSLFLLICYQHVRASFQSSSTFYFFLNCLSTHQIYLPFPLFHLPDSLLLLVHLLSFNLSPFSHSLQLFPMYTIYLYKKLSINTEENLENITTNFKRVKALNNLKEK